MNKFSFYKGGSAFWYLIIIGFSLSYTPALANNSLRNSLAATQQHQVQGTITDGANPLPGVTIAIKGKRNTTTISDFNGQYTLAVTGTDTLTVFFMGFKTALVPINGRKLVNIQLQEDITSLQEVRVNTGYYSVKESERTGSIAKITAAAIEKQPVINPLAAMQGRMAGVNITQETGAPGGGFSVQIRGINSIRKEGNEPLYVVNGVPYASQSLGNSTTAIGILPNSLSPLNNINPADIESIEVLKDADATAIYGSRGANGVVLITTKKGKEGKSRFTFQTYSTVGTVGNRRTILNTPQYLALRREAFANDGITQYPESAYDVNGTWDQNRQTNWQKELIGGTSYGNNAQASVSGGSATTQYMLGGTYHKETTVFPGNANYKKGVVNSSITHRSEDDTFHLTFSADYSTDKNNLPGVDLTRLSYTLVPNAPALYDEQGNLNWENGTFDNPLSFLEGSYLSNTQNLIANTLLSYRIVSDLELKTSLGYTTTQISEIRTYPSTIYNPFDNIGTEAASLYLNNGTRWSWIVEPQLNWKKNWGTLKFDVLVGTTFQHQRTEQLVQNGSGFTSNILINNLAAASVIEIRSHDVIDYKYSAIFGRFNFNWNNKYIINLTGRRDGSSRFGPGNQFANFGAIGAAWVFSKEAFLDTSVLSFGKMRGSFGITGNDQIGDYQFLNTYEGSGNNYNGTTGIQPTRLFNPNFGWEINKKLEVAVELGFFKDRIFITAAGFNNRSSNQLVGIPLPGTTGFSSLQANLDASVQNSGLELELRSVNFQNTHFNWTTTINGTIIKNKLVAFPNLQGSTYANSFVIGESLSIQKLYHYTGINPVTGTYTFLDYNQDGSITAPDDRQAIVDLSPKFYGGISNQLSYKNWQMDFLFQFVKQDARNELYSSGLPGTFSNMPASVLNHWPQNGINAVSQVYTTGANPEAIAAYGRFVDSDAVVTDASYVRLKTVSISYTIPTAWSKLFTGKLYLQGQNLLTFTKYKGTDPETNASSFLPPLKHFTLGLQIGF